MKKRKKISWVKLWDDFSNWMDEFSERVECKTCSHKKYEDPIWEDQQEKIKELVNAQLREIKMSSPITT